MDMPDISLYDVHKIIEDVDFEGTPVPGLRGAFYRRPAGDRTESVGVYSYADDELFMAWGYVGEEHCRAAAARRPDGAWDAVRTGCPDVRVLRTGDEVTGLAVGLADGGVRSCGRTARP
ncbi:hypothetical protein AB0M43_25935 [Longispora sp. NPDC051575]|uniref:hypothetical protein n=1 Tax=Longispora sp. NPDC051575 TaxID=3154943 RepID=UPI00344AE4CF